MSDSNLTKDLKNMHVDIVLFHDVFLKILKIIRNNYIRTEFDFTSYYMPIVLAR